MRICLVTEEISFGRGAGGIGGAFHELSLALIRAGHQVDIAHLPIELSSPIDPLMASDFANRGIRLFRPDVAEFAWAAGECENRSYGLFRCLSASEQPYDVIHFHDYKGLGYFSLAARQQRIAFPNTRMIVQVHGPTRWTLEANHHLFTHSTQLTIDFMERQSIARADVLVSPSRYMLNWLREKGWALPPDRCTHVIQNVCTHLRGLAPASHADPGPAREIIFFGRHEERKGLVPFCDALDTLAAELQRSGTAVTFLGGFGSLNAEDSAIYLAARARRWQFPVSVLPDFDRLQAARYLVASKASVVVIPSPAENSPYTVLEAIAVGKPIITSDQGGAVELIDKRVAENLTCPITPQALATKLRQAITTGLPVAQCAIPPAQTEQQWIELHNTLATERKPQPVLRKGKRQEPAGQTAPHGVPSVMAAITHYERPAKLFDAVMSLAAQTYPRLQIVVVDDGTKSPEAKTTLAGMRPLFDKLGIRLIEQQNLYLGAARNHAVRETDSDYVLFLDDDDIAFPTMVQTLLTAAEATGADVVNCLNLFMPESRRAEAHPFPSKFQQKASYIPIGGPISMTPLQNTLGAATALIRRSAFEELGGYTEQHGVGHEDLEFYVRALQAGMQIEVCPLPLYLYEVDRPSMASSTSRLRNAERVVHALDLAKSKAAWEDLIALNAGRSALENMLNGTAYLRSIDPNAALLRQIAETDRASAEYATLVGKLADRLGAREYARAMHSLEQARRARTGQTENAASAVPLVADVIPSAPPRVARLDMELMTALADLHFGRTAAAVAAFGLSFVRHGYRADVHHGRFIATLAESSAAEQTELRIMAGLLRKLRAQDAESANLAAAIFTIALRADDAELARSVAKRVFDAEDRSYLASNPDVAAAVENGGFPNGLAHFLRRGEEERRGGFVITRALADTVERVSGRRPMLNRLLVEIGEPEQAEPESASVPHVNGAGGHTLETTMP